MEHDRVVMTRVKQYLIVIMSKSSGIISTTSKHPFNQTILINGTIESIYIKHNWDRVVLKSNSLS